MSSHDSSISKKHFWNDAKNWNTQKMNYLKDTCYVNFWYTDTKWNENDEVKSFEIFLNVFVFGVKNTQESLLCMRI